LVQAPISLATGPLTDFDRATAQGSGSNDFSAAATDAGADRFMTITPPRR
jgi:hypothetical protein